jgi:hypothetical protein
VAGYRSRAGCVLAAAAARTLRCVADERRHKSIAGWQAADFLAAYNLPPASKGSGELVAVVSLDTVVAVGGTVLAKNGSQYSENAWRDSGAGCSDPSCPYRTVNSAPAGWGTPNGTNAF